MARQPRRPVEDRANLDAMLRRLAVSKAQLGLPHGREKHRVSDRQTTPPEAPEQG